MGGRPEEDSKAEEEEEVWIWVIGMECPLPAGPMRLLPSSC